MDVGEGSRQQKQQMQGLGDRNMAGRETRVCVSSTWWAIKRENAEAARHLTLRTLIMTLCFILGVWEPI